MRGLDPRIHAMFPLAATLNGLPGQDGQDRQ